MGAGRVSESEMRAAGPAAAWVAALADNQGRRPYQACPESSQDCWVQGAQQKQPPSAPVKMSTATKAHLAWPCLPVLEVDTSTT